MQTLVAPFINVLILVAAMVYFLRQPLRQFVEQRHVTLRDELKRVREMLSQSQSQYDEFSGKLKAIDVEIAALREQARQDGNQAKSRIVAEAQRLSASIVSDARMASQNLYSEFKGQLLSELAGRVLDRAEALIRERLTGEGRARIRQEFSSQVERVQ